MENKNEDIITPVKVRKNTTTEAQKVALKKYYEKNKNNEEYVKKARQIAKNYYEKNRGKVIKRVRETQDKNKINEMLKNLYELQKEGLINIHSQNLNADQHKKLEDRLADRMKVLGIIES
jgi:hypothetical protein